MQQSAWRALFAAQSDLDLRLDPTLSSAVLEPLQAAFSALEPDTDLATAKQWQPQLARALQQLCLPGWLISQLLSDHNDLLYRQAITQSLAEMRTEGWGEPPVGFCVLMMGSGGRHESLLHPDQDNALILEDYPLGRHNEIDIWFRTLAEQFTQRLDQAGIPYCRGEIMASRPLWRKPIGEWREQMRLWMGGRRVKCVQQCNILFDFAPVYGDERLAHQLREAIFEQIPQAGLFLHEMAELLDETPVALDRFDRLHSDGREAPHPHALNLKRQGLLPLSGALRLLALVHGCRAVSCRERLQWLEAHQHLPAGEAEALGAVADRFVSRLLDSQLSRIEAGAQPDNWVDVTRLSAPARHQLQEDLKQIRALQRRARPLR